MSAGFNGESNAQVDHYYDGPSSSRPAATANAPAIAHGKHQVMCGPLLNYHGMTGEQFWLGSVLIVLTPGGRKQPRLHIQKMRAVGNEQDTTVNAVASKASGSETIEGLRLYEDSVKVFWRFMLKIPLSESEMTWQYTIPDMYFLSEVSTSPSREFVVPALGQSMRLMFHSCNGFSVGTDEDLWSGPVLWHDVLRLHVKRPFHTMIGGGDQIYNDSIRVKGPLKAWTDISNPRKRQNFLFTEDLRQECDTFYFENYVRWFSTEPFATANASIPQINIWDDHDIIDGFGSYTDHFMRCPVFRGIGGTSFKYYCLFQHHTSPPLSTYTTDDPATMTAAGDRTAGADPRQLQGVYVYERPADDPSWIVGKWPGPYVEERSRSLYMRLGKRMAICGIDARTERTRRQVNYPETYDLIFDRLHSEFTAARGQITHLILLLGIPIAYPRLAWLENVLKSPLIAPIKLLNKRFGLAGGFFNRFDGKVDLLDDLDDHYTAKLHKRERKQLILRLQEFSKEFSVRVTILGGDVHLGALGRFYSAAKLGLPAERDHRYMANIISSAITNKPPPAAVANLLARRNKIHHLHDDATDEVLLQFFDKQPGGNMKSASFNHVTMPSRNFATITEVDGALHIPQVNGIDGTRVNGTAPEGLAHSSVTYTNGHSPLHWGEKNAGTKHPAADGFSSSSGMTGGLDISLRVEIDNQNKNGATEGYGFSIPPLTVGGTA